MYLYLQATSYQDGYTEDSETVKDFWAIADSLDGEQKKKLLMFVTGAWRSFILPHCLSSSPFGFSF